MIKKISDIIIYIYANYLTTRMLFLFCLVAFVTACDPDDMIKCKTLITDCNVTCECVIASGSDHCDCVFNEWFLSQSRDLYKEYKYCDKLLKEFVEFVESVRSEAGAPGDGCYANGQLYSCGIHWNNQECCDGRWRSCRNIHCASCQCGHK